CGEPGAVPRSGSTSVKNSYPMTPSGNDPAHAFTAGQRVAYTFRALFPQITPEPDTFSFSDGSKAVLRWKGPNLAGDEGLIRWIVSRCYLTKVALLPLGWCLNRSRE